MEPILSAHFNKFKQSFEINVMDEDNQIDKKKESEAFERFSNYIIFSSDYPEMFTADIDLLDFICVGGGADTGIDGIGIKINDRLIRNKEEIEQIVSSSKKINIEYTFIQAKMQSNIDSSGFNTFAQGVRHFFTDGVLPENDKIKEFRKLKDYLYSNEITISKMESNPSVSVYYVYAGNPIVDKHFLGVKAMLESDLKNGDYYFESVSVNVIDGRTMIKLCKELENNFSVQINIQDIFPLIINNEEKVKKAYAFTCKANELLKLLVKEDGSLRRSLFNDNVRDYLGNKGSVNSEMEKTLSEEPDMFLLCNNGITIVCTDFEQIRDKLVKIENPQIVNGCQTSNSIYNFFSSDKITSVQILVRLICTDDLAITNKIVRGTNKQNQVLDEAFEATKPFHQDLEEYFQSFSNEQKIYYERRSKQYNNDPLILKTQIVNLRIITQVFTAMFLGLPHESHRHEAKLLEDYGGKQGKLYNPEHDLFIYYLCGFTWYIFEKYFREHIGKKYYKTYRGHLYYLFAQSIGRQVPKLQKSKQLSLYCSELFNLLHEPDFSKRIEQLFLVFDEGRRKWEENGNSYHGIKDRREFTSLLTGISTEKYMAGSISKNTNDTKSENYRGQILSIRSLEDGKWYGFIKRSRYEDNIYFDNRAYKGDLNALKPNIWVEYAMAKKRNNLYYATFVNIVENLI
jgi:hypothetical protein